VNSFHPYTIFPLGDAALIIDFGNRIDPVTNEKVLKLFHAIRHRNIPFLTDLIPAYSSLTVCYDPALLFEYKNNGQTVFEAVAGMIEDLELKVIPPSQPPRLHEIPVCYEPPFAPDLEIVASLHGITPEEVVRLHTSVLYRVYMLGFLPGFAYMGTVDEKIAAPRKSNPRTRVEAGSVGIAEQQTGIYPMASPGGWQLIGRTPVWIFNDEYSEPALFSPGDEVRFFSINEHEFAHYQARHS
jgi:inhibitor of KinA